MQTLSLRNKRFGKAFRTFDALFAFLAAGKLGRAKSEKRLQRAESPTETLATQASKVSEKHQEEFGSGN